MPTASAAIKIRSGFMPCRIARKPSPSPPMRSAAGTSMPSKNISFESTAWRPLLVRNGVGRREAQVLCLALDAFKRGGAGEDENFVGDLRSRDPDFLPGQDVVIVT